jgi:D-alanine-D-alanine ligase-like ATP-grasp enzyme
MNKIVMKDLFKANNIPQVAHVIIHSLEQKEEAVKQL